jgi:hypothetical protein
MFAGGMVVNREGATETGTLRPESLLPFRRKKGLSTK